MSDMLLRLMLPNSSHSGSLAFQPWWNLRFSAGPVLRRAPELTTDNRAIAFSFRVCFCSKVYQKTKPDDGYVDLLAKLGVSAHFSRVLTTLNCGVTNAPVLAPTAGKLRRTSGIVELFHRDLLLVMGAIVKWVQSMTDEEKEIAKVGAEAALAPFGRLVERLFGGAVDQIGGAWEDRLKVRRAIRRIRLFERLQAAIDEAGFEPQPIADTIWIPALQEACLQDDIILQTAWANLLANAADPREERRITSSLINILRDLDRRDAIFLNALYAENRKRAVGLGVDDSELKDVAPYDHDDLLRIYAIAGLAHYPDLANLLTGDKAFSKEIIIDERGLAFTLDVLQKHSIVDKELRPLPLQVDEMQVRVPPAQDVVGIRTVELFYLTELGRCFVAACQRPRKDKESR
jgi:hypothetical protein